MVQVTINLTVARNKLSQNNVNRGRYALANQSLADMNQFVPMDEDILRMTGHVNNDGSGAIWDTPYAANLFYMPKYNFKTNCTDPLWHIKANRIFICDRIIVIVYVYDWLYS